jgi:hypothetical protein
MKRVLLTAVALTALSAPAFAGGMEGVFRAMGELQRAGFMCHSEALLEMAHRFTGDPDTIAYFAAHRAQANQWIKDGLNKFDQLAAQRGAAKNCDMAIAAFTAAAAQ